MIFKLESCTPCAFSCLMVCFPCGFSFQSFFGLFPFLSPEPVRSFLPFSPALLSVSCGCPFPGTSEGLLLAHWQWSWLPGCSGWSLSDLLLPAITHVLSFLSFQNKDGQYNIRCMEHVFHTDSHHMVLFFTAFLLFRKHDSGTVSKLQPFFFASPTSNSTCRTMAFLRCTFFPQ